MDSETVERASRLQAISLEFGPFRYDAIRRELHDASGPVRAGSRALQLLEVLLESPGRLCSREELVSRVWSHTVVEETSLRVHISALRRMLGDGQDGAKYITNVPGRGYAFVGEVRPGPGRDAGPPSSPHRLPARLTRPIGRGRDIARIGELLAMERLVSIVGAGGMGKTTVALAAAENQGAVHEQGSLFVDLSTISDAALVVVVASQSLGLDVARGEPGLVLEAALRDQEVLIVLDNCEHVVDAAAALADRLLRTCPRVRILATSREPLEAEAEWVFRLPPLGLPGPDATLAIDDVLSYPAIQLFVERARAGSDSFELTEGNVSAVSQVCEFLDGMPLAIEFAAARVNSLGAHGLLLRLESAFELLTRGRRTAMSRHQTLHAVLNWSYELLTPTERCVLQRLSVFRSAFDLDAAVAVAAGADLPGEQVIESVLSLCRKSLVVPDTADSGSARHRLLCTTRLFAERALAATSDANEVRGRHASFVLGALVRGNQAPGESLNYRRNLARAPLIAELRAAVAWALIDENDLVLGIGIMAESMYLHLAANLMSEAQRHLNLAIDKVARAGVEGSRIEFSLQKNLAVLTAQVLDSGEGLECRLARTRDLAARFGSVEERIEVLFAMITNAYGHGRYLQSLSFCDEVRELAQGDLAELSVAIGDRLATLNLHALGQHDAAERLAHRVLPIDPTTLPWRFQSTVPFSVSMRLQLARIHWLRADFQQAWATLQEAFVRDEGAHVHVKCQLFGIAAIPLAIWKGDRPTALRWVSELMAHATRACLPYWQAYATVFANRLEGLPVSLHGAEAQLLHKSVPLMDLASTLQPAAPDPSTLARVRNGEVGWCAPEVLRLAALADLDPQDPAGRARCIAGLREAHALSVEQGARFWSLRIAVSLCDVAAAGSADRAFARGVLVSLLNSIDDGSTQPDLQQARRRLEQGA